MMVEKFISHISSVSFLSIFLCLMGCGENQKIKPGSCSFAPTDSEFPIISGAYCNDCYFNVNFRDEQYSFSGNQLETGSSVLSQAPHGTIRSWEVRNVFLSFYLVAPVSDDELSSSLGKKTALLEADTLSNLENYPPATSVAFGIYNYCEDLFEPIAYSVDQSYNELTDIELIRTEYVGTNGGDEGEYQRHDFYCYGEIVATFILNGEEEELTANYKVTASIYERL